MCRYDGVNWRRLAAAGEGGKGGGGGGGDYLSMVVRKIFCSFFFARQETSGYWRGGHATSTSYHYRHTILWSY
jgi:hypothetical protein